MSEFYVHPEDAYVVRDENDHPKEARLYSCDGDHLHTFPAAWGDDQILLALRFANKVFDRGMVLGRAEKAHEIRRALELE